MEIDVYRWIYLYICVYIIVCVALSRTIAVEDIISIYGGCLMVVDTLNYLCEVFHA